MSFCILHAFLGWGRFLIAKGREWFMNFWWSIKAIICKFQCIRTVRQIFLAKCFKWKIPSLAPTKHHQFPRKIALELHQMKVVRNRFVIELMIHIMRNIVAKTRKSYQMGHMYVYVIWGLLVIPANCIVWDCYEFKLILRCTKSIRKITLFPWN